MNCFCVRFNNIRIKTDKGFDTTDKFKYIFNLLLTLIIDKLNLEVEVEI
jgi:hypothetical protein